MEAEAPVHPLLEVLRACTVQEQHDIAAQAGTKRNYLYQISSRTRTPKIQLAQRISKAVLDMHVKTTGRVPKISVEQLVGVELAV